VKISPVIRHNLAVAEKISVRKVKDEGRNLGVYNHPFGVTHIYRNQPLKTIRVK
jgi:hypothetical protein